jgi:hypothetical protein
VRARGSARGARVRAPGCRVSAGACTPAEQPLHTPGHTC